MTKTRFNIDLLHTGRIAETWQDWFLGAEGGQRLVLCAGVGVILLLLGFVGGVYLPSRGLTNDQREIGQLRQTLASKSADLAVVKRDLGALSEEARRQVRWSELLNTFSEQIPSVLKLQKVALTTAPPPPAAGGQPPPSSPPRAVGLMQIEAQTPLRPGGPPLLETAKFMAGIMRDPAVNKRFQLKSWEIKPPGTAQDTQPLLSIGVTLSERAQ
jgi:hypothetical protein